MTIKTFRVGDRVKWQSSGGTVEGQVVEIATESLQIGDFVYDASKDNPRYIVVTDEGRRAAHAIAQASNRSARLIRYLELAHSTAALPAARAIVESSHDPEVLAACLRLLNSAEDLEIVRSCLAHEDWRVRVQAASALGRLGGAEDGKSLIPLLSDKEWWVRYRAAQALARLPSTCEAKLEEIQAQQSDPFARDMLTQVTAEVELQ